SSRSCAAVCCTASSKYNGLLSFHGFPSHPELRRQWLVTIRRDKLKLTLHSKVCSLHFTPDQLLQPKAAGGRRMVKRGAVPVLFPWSHQSVQPPRAGQQEPESRPDPDGRAADPPVGFRNENETLKEEIKKQVEELKIPSSFGLQRDERRSRGGGFPRRVVRGIIVPASLCFLFLSVSLCWSVSAALPTQRVSVRLSVSAAGRVQPRVRVGAVPVAAAQGAEHHGAAQNGAAVFDLQVDGVVVDLQGSCPNTANETLLASIILFSLAQTRLDVCSVQRTFIYLHIC
uniref:THAP domain-containing protein 1 n=1 Tax=Poecilia latipinna TaxID=48699 RepID=A0A3B3TRL5_9TELE